jgi:GNAT superfamily N-acetyltransferase
MKDFTIRAATHSDAKTILSFIKSLAEYEKLSHEVIATEQGIEKALFGDTPFAKALIAYYEEIPVGIALYFYNFSTFLGKPGIYLEDLFVMPEYRKRGFGKALLTKLAQIAIDEDCGRVEWSVLKWNKPSIDFYESIEAKPMDEWTIYRLSGENISKLAKTNL